MADFVDYKLDPLLQKGLDSCGYVHATPVQQQVLEVAFSGSDLYVQSQTGTGKTCAYLCVIIQQLLCLGQKESEKDKKNRVLVLVPTRELAVQVEQEAKKLCAFTKLKVASFYGGTGYEKQIAALKQKTDFVIGTPGRVIDLQKTGVLDFSKLEFLVIDEADRMFDMGFYPDLRYLIGVLPPVAKRQTMLFSATLNTYVKNLSYEYTKEPKEISIEPEHITVDQIKQLLFHVASSDKNKLLLWILQQKKPASVIVFCNTKNMCQVLTSRLKINGISCAFISGDLPQEKRLQVLKNFKDKKITCLVATDLAARGLDIDDLEMVINYDLPTETQNYVHRIGRTARAGKSGVAYTFCCEQDVYDLVPLQRYLGKDIPSQTVDESYFVNDKSAGHYIKTNSYTKDASRTVAKKTLGGYKDRPQQSQRQKARGQGRYSSKEKVITYKRDQRVKDFRATNDSIDLASLSYEERLAYYKQKYQKKQTKKENYSPRRPNRLKQVKKTYKMSASPAPTKTQNKQNKKGLFLK